MTAIPSIFNGPSRHSPSRPAPLLEPEPGERGGRSRPATIRLGESPVLADMRRIPCLSAEEQERLLRAFRSARRDIDWILAIAPPARRIIAEIRAIVAADHKEVLRYSSFFHLPKTPRKPEGHHSPRARYLALMDRYLELARDLEPTSIHGRIDAIAEAFRALDVAPEVRDRMARELHAAHKAKPDPHLRSLAIMLSVARAESEARLALIERHNLRLVAAVARRMTKPGAGLDFSDLLGEGVFGLRRAAEKFDPELGHRFSTYAVWWIRQAIGRAMQERSHLIRRPAHARADAEHGHAKAPILVPIDEPIAGTDDLPLAETLPTDDASPEETALRDQIRRKLTTSLTKLEALERLVIAERLRSASGELPVESLSRRLGLQPAKLRRIERKALGKLASCPELRSLHAAGPG